MSKPGYSPETLSKLLLSYIIRSASFSISGTDPDDYDETAFFGENPVKTIKGFTVIVGNRDDITTFDGNTTIFRGEGYYSIDCGVERGGRLGCLRLDDGKEFYV